MCSFVGHRKIWQEGLSGLSGFIEQEQLLSNVIEREDASKRYSFSSALIISEVCDIEQLFPFSSGLQTSSPVKTSILFHPLQSLPQSRFFPLAWESRRAVLLSLRTARTFAFTAS